MAANRPASRAQAASRGLLEHRLPQEAVPTERVVHLDGVGGEAQVEARGQAEGKAQVGKSGTVVEPRVEQFRPRTVLPPSRLVAGTEVTFSNHQLSERYQLIRGLGF